MILAGLMALALAISSVAKTPDLRNLHPRYSEKPCELLRYFGKEGQFTIGGQSFSSKDIAVANQQFDEFTNSPIVSIEFTQSGRVKFRSAQKIGVGGLLPICLDKKTISVPRLNELILGGQVHISGAFTVVTADALARKIKNAL